MNGKEHVLHFAGAPIPFTVAWVVTMLDLYKNRYGLLIKMISYTLHMPLISVCYALGQVFHTLVKFNLMVKLTTC